MKKMIIICTIILFVIGIDALSTYMVTGGILDNENELHFIIQIFKGSFNDLLLFFDFKVLNLKPHRSPCLFKDIRQQIPLGVPIVLIIVLCSHGFAALNIFFIYAYKNLSDITSHFTLITNSYIQYIHIEQRMYMYFILLILLMLGCVFFFLKKQKLIRRSNQQHA